MESPPYPRAVNNDVYEGLGARWYEAEDDPIALLRAESAHRNPWIESAIGDTFRGQPCDVLDLGCGAGFLSNFLGKRGHRVVGLDTSPDSLAVARAHDESGTVRYEHGSALALTHADASFDVVCAMDFLEHVESPARIIAEAARVLRPGGLFFFHTFNRNWLSWLVVIKGVEWFVKNTPKDLHVLHLFLKPEETIAMCRTHGLELGELHGSRPRLGAPFFRMLATGIVGPDFGFAFTRSTRIAYTGFARKVDKAENPGNPGLYSAKDGS